MKVFWKRAGRRERRRQSAGSLASVFAISFSLTFVAAGMLLLAGVLPPALSTLNPPVELGVLLLLVPLCALVLAILFEVLRAAIKGLPRVPVPRAAPALSDWRPGHGEG